MQYRLSSDRAWLTVTQTEGFWWLGSPNDALSPGTTGKVVVNFNTSGLATGTYTGNIYITSGNVTETIPVTLTINQPPSISSGGDFSSCISYMAAYTLTPNTECRADYTYLFGTDQSNLGNQGGGSTTGHSPVSLEKTYTITRDRDYYHQLTASNGVGATNGEIIKIPKDSIPPVASITYPSTSKNNEFPVTLTEDPTDINPYCTQVESRRVDIYTKPFNANEYTFKTAYNTIEDFTYKAEACSCFYITYQVKDLGGNYSDVAKGPEVCIQEGCCDVSVRVEKSWVAPQKTGSNTADTQADITLTLNKPAPLEGCTVKLKVEPVEESGGHNHDSSRNEHVGTLSRDTVVLKEIGPNSIRYTSGEVAGTEKMVASLVDSTGKPISSVELPIDVKVPMLGVLGSSAEWRLTGSYGEPGVKSMHYNNHYGEAYTIDAMIAIVRKYFKKTGATLGINDMSLIWGGLFDIGNNWSSDPAHSWHRKGTSVDIDRYVWDTKENKYILILCEDDDKLQKIVEYYHGRLICESKGEIKGKKHIEF